MTNTLCVDPGTLEQAAPHSIRGGGGRVRCVGWKCGIGRIRCGCAALSGKESSGPGKPRSEGEALSELIVGELRDHRRPDAALKEIKEIRSDQEKVKQFVFQFSESVAQIIRLNRTDLPLEGIQTKTATVILDFLIDCPRRPMRCLALDKMLQAYADRITGIGSE